MGEIMAFNGSTAMGERHELLGEQVLEKTCRALYSIVSLTLSPPDF